MIDKKIVQEIIDKEIAETDLYLVELNVSTDNTISVMVDAMEGVNIETCIKLSRAIEQHFDREEEDFELQVSSAGIGQAFKVLQQYHKNIGRHVEVLSTEGLKTKGKLLTVSESGFDVEIEEMVKVEGKKKKQLVVSTKHFDFDQVKSTKDIIIF
ncbi:MAG: ribosome assembly cofactor RimP [Marinifilaceae bacterium]